VALSEALKAVHHALMCSDYHLQLVVLQCHMTPEVSTKPRTNGKEGADMAVCTTGR
jgi:hypothetical protein